MASRTVTRVVKVSRNAMQWPTRILAWFNQSRGSYASSGGRILVTSGNQCQDFSLYHSDFLIPTTANTIYFKGQIYEGLMFKLLTVHSHCVMTASKESGSNDDDSDTYHRAVKLDSRVEKKISRSSKCDSAKTLLSNIP